jgi:hypothetical protein
MQSRCRLSPSRFLSHSLRSHSVVGAEPFVLLIPLLAGGKKSTQQSDIETAIHLARNFQEQQAMPKTIPKKAGTARTMPYDVAAQLRTPEETAAYLDAWLEEAPDDAAGITRALGVKMHAEAA